MMKISKSEIQKVSDEPIGLFYQGMRAPATKEKYTRTLRRILCDFFEDVLEGTFEERASQLVQKAKSDPEWITSLLLTLSKRLKERTDLPRTDMIIFFVLIMISCIICNYWDFMYFKQIRN